MRLRPRVLAVALILLTLMLPVVRAQRPASAPSPASAWPQFRGNAHLTGAATSVLPAALTLQWTYDVGESIESSAAIADGVVYVGSTSGDLVALDLGVRRPALEVRDQQLDWRVFPGRSRTASSSSGTMKARFTR